MDPKEPETSEDFARLLDEYERSAGTVGKAAKEPEMGDVVSGTVFEIGEETVFVDLGGKAEGQIARLELVDAEGKITVAVGDALDARVAGRDRETGAILLRRKGGGKGEIGLELKQAHELGLPIEGMVTGINKGGAEVEIGGQRAFCPLSQLDLRYVEDPSTFVGRKLTFKVTRLEEGKGRGGANVVLSRRALLEEEQQARAAEARAKISVGTVVHGRVTSLASYGAFVDLGGIEGLLHVSEIGHGRLGHPQEVLAVGQEIEVQVLRIEPAKESAKPGRREKSERISLSRKVLERDPWRDAVERYPVGSEWPGRVMRLESFGAFVELAPGLEGLVHVSELAAAKRIQHAREAVQLGQDLRVRVLGVDAERRRISLTLAPQEKLRAEEMAEWQAGETAAPGEGFGSLGDFFKGEPKKD